jgi:excisionase family DNA binding protein
MKTAKFSTLAMPETAPDPAPAPLREVPRFLTRGEVAKLFGVSASTVTRWARAGLLASVRTPGGHYRYRAQDALLAVQAAERGKDQAP